MDLSRMENGAEIQEQHGTTDFWLRKWGRNVGREKNKIETLDARSEQCTTSGLGPRMQKSFGRSISSGELRKMERDVIMLPVIHATGIRTMQEENREGHLVYAEDVASVGVGIPSSPISQPATLHDPLLDSSEFSADAGLRSAETKYRSAVSSVLLRVAHQVKCNSSWHNGQGNCDERDSILVPRRDKEGQIVCTSLLAAI